LSTIYGTGYATPVLMHDSTKLDPQVSKKMWALPSLQQRLLLNQNAMRFRAPYQQGFECENFETGPSPFFPAD